MFEWLSQHYIQLIANYKILLGDLTHCYAVDRLRLFTLILLIVLFIKLIIHFVLYYRLRRKFPEYLEQKHPKVIDVFRIAAQKAKVQRLPRLYQFSNQNPLVFTIGTLKPAIFLAPQLLTKLTRAELEAILVHELSHIKRRDTFLKWLLELLYVAIPVLIVQMFAFNFVFSGPNSEFAIWGAVGLIIIFRGFVWKRILLLRELSCDDQSVKANTDPLHLATSLVKVCRMTKGLPKHQLRNGLVFAQTLLPNFLSFEFRTRRLINYRRPWFKFFLGKAIRVIAVFLLIFTSIFLWRFHSVYGQIQLRIEHLHQQDCAHKILLINTRGK